MLRANCFAGGDCGSAFSSFHLFLSALFDTSEFVSPLHSPSGCEFVSLSSRTGRPGGLFGERRG